MSCVKKRRKVGSCGRTPLSGDRAQTSFLFLEPKKSEIGRRGIASHRLRQAWNRKRRSQFLQLVFFGLSKQVWWDFVGEHLLDTPDMIGQSCGHRWCLIQLLMDPAQIVGASNQIHPPLKGREMPIGVT